MEIIKINKSDLINFRYDYLDPDYPFRIEIKRNISEGDGVEVSTTEIHFSDMETANYFMAKYSRTKYRFNTMIYSLRQHVGTERY